METGGVASFRTLGLVAPVKGQNNWLFLMTQDSRGEGISGWSGGRAGRLVMVEETRRLWQLKLGFRGDK